jgi:VanZ family protein
VEDVAARGRLAALRSWLPVALYCLAIAVASSIPGRSMPSTSLLRFDKLIHCAEYALLGALVARGFALGPPRLGRWAGAAAAAALAALFGATDEWHQSFTPGRYASGLDLVADAGGSVLGALAFAWLRRGGGHGDHP